jgi:hypothetical protein
MLVDLADVQPVEGLAFRLAPSDERIRVILPKDS